MDWFRWYHGAVDDPKFGLVARKAGASVAEVIAVWAVVLEAASANSVERGTVGGLDFEAVDFRLGLHDGKAQAIYAAMSERQLIVDGDFVAAWDRRQPKRERVDDRSTERVRAFRQKQRHETPSNATQRHATPRGEERRVEKKKNPPLPPLPSEPGELVLSEQQGVPAPSAQGIVSRETWLTWYAEQWPHGKLPFGQAGKVLKAVVAEIGEAKAKQAWVAYCRSVAGTPQFFSLAKFGQTFRVFLGANGSGPVSAALDAKLDAIFGEGDGGEAIEV